MRCFPLSFRAKAVPFMARLSASLPPPVNRISFALAPISFPTEARASSKAHLASLPQECRLLGLPYFSEKYGSIAANTSSATAVVAE